MSELDARQRTILKAVIVEYVSGAEPVGSELIAQKYGLGVKSATIRNELSEMADRGFLELPHTSAGRIPSDLGYRYYVDHLVVRNEADESAKHRLQDAASDGDALQRLLSDTARALSRLTHLLTVATAVRDQHVTVKTALVSALGPNQALLVVAFSNGHVENRMVECPLGLTLHDIGLVNEALGTLVGKTVRSLLRPKLGTASTAAADKLIASLTANLKGISREMTRGVVVTEGEEFMFAQPEFQRDAGALAELLKDLHESDVLYEAVAPGDAGQVVTIGRENRIEQLRRFSVVRNAFFIGETEAGVIAIVGPTRMQYEAGIPLVNFAAKALSDSLTRFLG